MSLSRRVELMIRFLFLAVLYFAGNAFLLQAQTPGTANPDNVFTDISISEDHGALAILLSIKNIPFPPRTSKLSDPERLIFDFSGVLPKAGNTRTTVESHSVKDVRVAIFANDARGRPITRVVLDLERPVGYETRNEPGKFVIVVRDTPSSAISAASHAAKAPRVQAIEPKAPVTGNRLTNIDFGDSSVTLTFAFPIAPRRSTLHDPERLVLDVPGVVTGMRSPKSIPDSLRSNVTAIRMAQFRQDPPIYRIVFDEPSPNTSSQLSVEGNRVTVHFSLQRETRAGSVRKNESPIISRRISPAPTLPSIAGGLTNPPSTRALAKRTNAPAGGPKVDYTNGLLRIEATNANLADVLYAVGEKTGAVIDMPFSDSMLDQVTFTMGPGKPRDVLSTILEGSGFNYYIVENSTGGLEKIILIPKQE